MEKIEKAKEELMKNCFKYNDYTDDCAIDLDKAEEALEQALSKQEKELKEKMEKELEEEKGLYIKLGANIMGIFFDENYMKDKKWVIRFEKPVTKKLWENVIEFAKKEIKNINQL